jgi:hypothetical protein
MLLKMASVCKQEITKMNLCLGERFLMSSKGSSIGWRSRLMKRRSLVRISLPSPVWTCQNI